MALQAIQELCVYEREALMAKTSDQAIILLVQFGSDKISFLVCTTSDTIISAAAEEGLPEEDRRGGEILGLGSQLARDLSSGGGQSGIASRRSSTKRCGPRVDLEDAGARTNMQTPCRSSGQRCTVGSTQEPAVLNPSGAIPQEFATEGHFDSPGPSAPSQPSLSFDPSVLSTSAGASWPTALHESAGKDIAFPLPHPSDAATSRTSVGSGLPCQRGQEKSYSSEFLHLNAAFQNCLKLFSEQTTAGFHLLSNSILELQTRLGKMHSDAGKSPNHSFFQSVLERIDKLSPDQQMPVMQVCQSALSHVSS
ncbi:uncharacterized protein [Ranitomeya imitator]|uniref:uncharacterized protein n=1 Tax=Ranitomeya imitator TaxID=111125 RepID=UPI0037E80E15